MGSVRTGKPVKLFIAVPALEDARDGERLEDRLRSEFGPSDHRLSLVPSDASIHRVLLSFERLIEIDTLPEIRDRIQPVETEFSARLEIGFLDNYQAALGALSGGRLFQFRSGVIQLLSSTPAEYQSGKVQEFFIWMRKAFRAQLRSMCLLRQ